MQNANEFILGYVECPTVKESTVFGIRRPKHQASKCRPFAYEPEKHKPVPSLSRRELFAADIRMKADWALSSPAPKPRYLTSSVLTPS